MALPNRLTLRALLLAAAAFALAPASCNFGGGDSDEATGGAAAGLSADPNAVWDFSNPADYLFNPTKIQVSAGGATLVVHPHVDSGNGATDGFGGGTHSRSRWDGTGITLDPAAAGLPSNALTTGFVDMSANVLLFHLDEASGMTALGDASGSANGGACATCPTLGVPGRFSTAAAFTGASLEYFTVARSTTLEPTRVSVEVWVKGGAQSASKYLLAKDLSYALRTSAAGGLVFAIGGTGGVFTASPDASPAIWDGNWHHVAGTYDGAFVRLYVDGAEVGGGTAETVAIAYDPTQPVTIGGYTGALDELAIYGRALSASEIAAHAQRSGVFVSRVFDATAAAPWSDVAFTATTSVGAPLPAAGTALLLHFDEAGSVAGTTCSTCPSPVAGKFAGARSFTSGQLLTLTTPGAIPSGAQPRTVEYWLNPSAAGGPVFSLNPVTGQGFYLETQSFSDGVNAQNKVNLAGIELPPAGVWSHVAWVLDGAGGWAYYRNGRIRKSGTFAVPINTGAAASVTIGHRADTATFLGGTIDELAVYPRALAANELIEHALRGTLSVTMQARSCSLPACADSPAFGSSGGAAANRFFQYRATLTTADAAVTPVLTSVTVTPPHFDLTQPSIASVRGVAGQSFKGFTETLGPGNSGKVRYQLSRDAIQWFHHDGSKWVRAADSLEANTAAEIDAKISTLGADVGDGSLFFKAFLDSQDGTKAVSLQRLEARIQ